MSTFAKEFSSDKVVVIPPIQREYVQPLNESIITGFVDALVKAYLEDERKDLNYIYGLESSSHFEPVDGQQRLTTLWLLHLYVAARKGEELPAKLVYRTRDIASDFCVRLRENARSMLSRSEHPSEDIANANWFIETWSKNVTVYSMLHALDVIHQRIVSADVDLDRLWENMIKADSPVTFAFKSTEDLGDDVYVKMNARGKFLSDYENLKSWLDDRLTELVKDESNPLDTAFLRHWRENIDNEWTDLFWENRNLNDLFPEEIDDEQMRLFYNIAFMLWARKSKSERAKIIRNPSETKAIASLLKADENKIEDAVLNRMRKSKVDLPLYLLDKLDIFNPEFFMTASEILNGLIHYEDEINNNLQLEEGEDLSEKIYFWDLPKAEKSISFMCQLLMSEKGEDVPYTKMAIGAALCCYVQNVENKTPLRDWMRFIRNVANNIRIEADTIDVVLTAFNNWARLCATTGIKGVILQAQGGKRGFESKQLDEEKAKAALFDNPASFRAICRLENHKFFLGRVGFLLEIIKNNAREYDKTLIDYADILFNFFGDNGPRFDSSENGYLAHRVLLACSRYYGIGYYHKRNWCLLESKEDWKNYLEDFASDNDAEDPQARNMGISRLLEEIGTAGNLSEDRLNAVLEKYKCNVSDWRRPLLEHSDLWDYMRKKRLRFENNYNVLLIPGVILQSSGHRSELRARSLYSDLKNGECLTALSPRTDGEEEYNPCGWSLNFWDYGSERTDKDSCIYFEKGNCGEKFVIDIYFDVEFAHRFSTEDAYCLELFIRENNRDDNELLPLNESVWHEIVESIDDIEVTRGTNQGRYVYKHLTKEGIISLLVNKILRFR